ncbi:hypothetical protein J3R30DRAFT_39677 [Lentinula aciculospora]|uniref:Chromo domain-containing protein n=1 Tax=Lentinula aciculospora TaxID=153920 RepID=A0A9W9ATF2_9AGAR|nr:hypothetical protein J3R30DRAFT_39677 [Lentinula aciculospora]
MGVFKCLPCTKGTPSSISAANELKCSRPDCTEKTEEDVFFVERIIGRSIQIEGGVGRKHLWLVKWLNYPVYRATWEGDDSIGDGIEDDISSTILLKEASDGGWNHDEPEVIPLVK